MNFDTPLLEQGRKELRALKATVSPQDWDVRDLERRAAEDACSTLDSESVLQALLTRPNLLEAPLPTEAEPKASLLSLLREVLTRALEQDLLAP